MGCLTRFTRQSEYEGQSFLKRKKIISGRAGFFFYNSFFKSRFQSPNVIMDLCEDGFITAVYPHQLRIVRFITNF